MVYTSNLNGCKTINQKKKMVVKPLKSYFTNIEAIISKKNLPFSYNELLLVSVHGSNRYFVF